MAWQAANNGSGKRVWFLINEAESDLEKRYHWTSNGTLIRYASHIAADKAAAKLNTEMEQAIPDGQTSVPLREG